MTGGLVGRVMLITAYSPTGIKGRRRGGDRARQLFLSFKRLRSEGGMLVSFIE